MTKKSASKKTGDDVSQTAVISPLDEYEPRPDAQRSAEETAKAERRFGAEQTEADPDVVVEVPDITAEDVERILAEEADAVVDKDALARRVEEIENSGVTIPPDVPGGSSFTDNTTPQD
jgi:hypothetical protein